MAPNIQYRVKTCEVLDPNSSLRERERGFTNAFQQTEWLALLELQLQLRDEAMNSDGDGRDILPIITN